MIYEFDVKGFIIIDDEMTDNNDFIIKQKSIWNRPNLERWYIPPI